DESESKTPQNVPSFVQPSEQVKSPRPSVQHVETSIPPANSKTPILQPTSNGKRRNRKACFVCKSLDHLIKDCDYHEKKMAQTTTRNHAQRGTHKQYAKMTHSKPQRHVIPAAVLTQSKLVPITAVRPVNTVVPNTSVTIPRQAKIVVTKTNSTPRRHINRCSGKIGMETKMSNLRPCFLQHKCINDPQKGNPQHGLKDKGVIDSGCSRHITRSMSYLVAGPSNAAASPTHGKSSRIDTFQLPDDPNMPELEDITYSDDEEDVGAEADFNNLESSITVSPIPTTRVHKDHPVTQIIGDLSSATQIRSMTRVAKDQGGLSQINNAYASFMGFMVYQMDVKSTFQYGTIEEEIYVCQPLVFEDPDYPKKKKDGIFIIQDKYVAEILRKFGLTDGKSASTPIDTDKPLLKDPDGEDVALSGMESLKRMVHDTNISSAGYLTTPQMVLNSQCLTHIKNWLV
nr:hypothetical protein [Tanacetum cinerariifolium]